MRKIADENIFEDAYKELDPDSANETSVIDKTAFDIHLTPGSLIGALTGALIAGKKTKADILKRQMENESAQTLSGNYYSQVQNIAKTLRVMFTPFGVTYMVRSNNREVAIQTIETEAMNQDMYGAWQHKDEQYFKNLMLNKMYTDLQTVEQHFAKNFLQNQLGLQNQINKHAYEEEEVLAEVEEMSDFHIIEKIAEVKDFYGKQNATTEKLAEIMMKIMDDGTIYKVSWGLEKPFEKYAGLGNALSFLGFGNNSTDLKKFSNPNYLAGKVKVGFMPDRVVYTVDNTVVSTLLAVKMNEEAFNHFEKQDKEYFVNLFKNEAIRGLQRMNGKIPPNSPLIEKKASYEGIKQIFERGDIHPIIYFLLLTRKYSAQWMTWDAVALVKILETDFELNEGIEDIPLNKILSVQAANRSDAVYTQHHAIEKVIRAFNNKPIDFMARQIDDMDMEDVAFGLDVLERVTPHDNIYQNLTQNVFNHIIEMLLADENKIFYPTVITEEEYQQNFVNAVNEALLDGINEKDIARIDDVALESKTIQENEIIAHIGLDLLKKLKQIKKQHTNIDDEKFISTMVDKLEIPLEPYVKELIKKHVIKNIEMDIFLTEQNALLQRQVEEFGL